MPASQRGDYPRPYGRVFLSLASRLPFDQWGDLLHPTSMLSINRVVPKRAAPKTTRGSAAKSGGVQQGGCKSCCRRIAT